MLMRDLLNIMETAHSVENRVDVEIRETDTGKFLDQLTSYGDRFILRSKNDGTVCLVDKKDGYNLDTFTMSDVNRMKTEYGQYPINQIAMYVSQKGWPKIQISEENSDVSPMAQPRRKLTTIEKILMRRDEMTQEEARDELLSMRERVQDGENPEEVLYDYGLEPDYFFDLI